MSIKNISEIDVTAVIDHLDKSPPYIFNTLFVTKCIDPAANSIKNGVATINNIIFITFLSNFIFLSFNFKFDLPRVK